jgi:hypothetical protein
MSPHRIQKDWKSRLKSAVPLGLGQGPEGNVIVPRGVYDPIGGVPDYNARVRVGKIQPQKSI